MTARTQRAVPWLFVLPILGFVACDPDLETRFFVEDFETLCDGAPCGWERSAGAEGDVTYVSTIHPGIHGLRLRNTVSARGPGGPARLLEGDLFSSVTATCDPGATLDITVVVSSELGGITTYSSPLFFGDGDDFQRIETPIRVDGFIGQTVTVQAVILEKRGSGTCTVDDVLLDTTPFCEGGCC